MLKLLRLKCLLRHQYKNNRIYFGLPELHKREEEKILSLKEKAFSQMKNFKNRDLEINARLTAFDLRHQRSVTDKIFQAWRERYRSHSKIHFYAINASNIQERAFEAWLTRLRHQNDVEVIILKRHAVLTRFKAFQKLKLTLSEQIMPLKCFTVAQETLIKQKVLIIWRHALLIKLNISDGCYVKCDEQNEKHDTQISENVIPLNTQLISAYRHTQAGYDDMNAKYISLSTKCNAFTQIIHRRASYRAFYAWRGSVATVRILKCLRLRRELKTLKKALAVWREKSQIHKMQRMYFKNPQMHNLVNKFLSAVGEKIIKNGGIYGAQIDGKQYFNGEIQGRISSPNSHQLLLREYKPGEFNEVNQLFIKLCKLDQVEKDSFQARKLLRNGLLAFKFNHEQMIQRYTRADAFYERILRNNQRKIFYKFWNSWIQRKIVYNFTLKKEEAIMRKFMALMMEVASTSVLTHNINQYIRKYLCHVAIRAWYIALKNQKVALQLRNFLLLNGVADAENIVKQLLQEYDGRNITFNEFLEKLLNNSQILSKLPQKVQEKIKQILDDIPGGLVNTKQFQSYLQKQQICDKFVSNTNYVQKSKFFIYIKNQFYMLQAKEFKISQKNEKRCIQEANKAIMLQVILQQYKQMQQLRLQKFSFEQFITSYNCLLSHNNMLKRVTMASFKQYCKERSVEKFITQNFEQRKLNEYFQILKRVSKFYYMLKVLKDIQNEYFKKVVQLYLQSLYECYKINNEKSVEIMKQHNLNVINKYLSNLLMYQRNIQIRYAIKNEQASVIKQKNSFQAIRQYQEQLSKKQQQQTFNKNKFIYHKIRQALKATIKQQSTFQSHHENTTKRIALINLYNYYKTIEDCSKEVSALVQVNKQQKEQAEKMLLLKNSFQCINTAKKELNAKQQQLEQKQREYLSKTLIPYVYQTISERNIFLQKQLNNGYKLHNKNIKQLTFTLTKFELYQKLIMNKGQEHGNIISMKIAFRNIYILYKAQRNYNLCLERLSLHSLIWFKKQCGQISYLMRVKIKESLRQWRRIAHQNTVHRHLEIKADKFYTKKLMLRVFQTLILEAGITINSD